MQTFLPYQSFIKSLECLDNKRLGKQRVEALQILNTLTGKSNGWKNHPAVRMWRGYEKSLMAYHDQAILFWINRGFQNSMKLMLDRDDGMYYTYYEYPPWLTPEFCRSHQSNLLRKDLVYYSQFGWQVPLDLPYVWPV